MTQPTIKTLNAEALSGRLQQLAQGAGIQQWDLGASCSTDTSVQVDRGEAKQMKGAQRSAITLRVWNGDGLVGITSTSDLSDSGLARALSGARDASAFGNAEETPAFSPRPRRRSGWLTTPTSSCPAATRASRLGTA